MTTSYKHLEQLGFDDTFLDGNPELVSEFEIARVVAVHKDSVILSDGRDEVPAELVGKLLYGADSPDDLPTVGDWVLAKYYDNKTFSMVHAVLPRKTLLNRKTPGKRIDVQLIAANIDVAFIVQSLDANFNLRRLERYLVMIHEAGIEPIVLLSKSDLMPAEDIGARCDEIHQIMPEIDILAFSSKDRTGLAEVIGRLEGGKTYCLLGSSGVGKTTLLNHLIGEPVFRTRTTRAKDGKGRHATTHRQIIRLDCGAMVVDTPGMRELGNISVFQGLDETFSDISELSRECRFGDCTHTREKGCAVLKAVGEGRLAEKRYANFMKMTRESEFNQMSYFEKRMKDKQFGKMVKTIMQHKKNRR